MLGVAVPFIYPSAVDLAAADAKGRMDTLARIRCLENLYRSYICFYHECVTRGRR